MIEQGRKGTENKGHGLMVDVYSLGVLLYEMLVGLPPFYDSSKTEMYKKILNNKPKFPNHVPAKAKDLITKLLEKDPSKRLGAINGFKDIKDHPYCQTIDWIRIKNRTLPDDCIIKPYLD